MSKTQVIYYFKIFIKAKFIKSEHKHVKFNSSLVVKSAEK